MFERQIYICRFHQAFFTYRSFVKFCIQRQFWNLEYRGKKVIVFVFPVLGFFVAKFSFEIVNCQVKQRNGRAKCKMHKILAHLFRLLDFQVYMTLSPNPLPSLFSTHLTTSTSQLSRSLAIHVHVALALCSYPTDL